MGCMLRVDRRGVVCDVCGAIGMTDKEHPMDRIKRVHSDPSYGRIREIKFRFCDAGFEYSPYKNGRFFYVENPVTNLVQCQHCPIFSTPKKVQYRPTSGFRIGSKHSDCISSQTLCMGCWNRIRPLTKKLDDLETALSMVRSTQRKFNETAKNNA